MPVISVSELIPLLQIAIGPVILVSGVGLLLLTMTNRLGRVVDRSRILSHELREAPIADRDRVLGQLSILSRRARLIQRAITLASISVLLAAILVIVLFLTAVLRLESAWLISALFIACMVSLIGSLVEFIRDVNQSLSALKLELGQVQ
jgi:hypothetical protein